MNKRVFVALSIFLLGFLGAGEAWALHPARAKLLLHTTREITPEFSMGAHFLPASDLAAGDFSRIKPMVYLGADFKVASWLTLSPFTGWVFKDDIPLFGVWIYLPADWFWALEHIEVRPEKNFYYFMTNLQANVVGKWLCVGVEQESWFFSDNDDLTSNGVGPNVMLRFGDARLDLAFQFRDKATGGFDGEFYARFHAYF